MEADTLNNQSYTMVLHLPKTEDDRLAAHAFIATLEDVIMGYSLSEVELDEFSKETLLKEITDFNTGELLPLYYQDMINRHSNPTDYVDRMLQQVKAYVEWFLANNHTLTLEQVGNTLNVRDIDSIWYERPDHHLVVMILIGEKCEL